MSFQAIRIDKSEQGQSVALVDFDEKDLMDGDVTVAVEWSTVNYKDGLAITGKAPVVRRFPMIPGIDFAGVVERSSHPEWKAGDRVVLNGSLFHEELIKMAGNPFFLRALEQANRMRRLLEYRAKVDRQRVRSQCTEHLQIVALLEKGDVIEASYLMRQHLSGALARKAPRVHGPDEDPEASPARRR